ncbi:MAG TPA: homoserine dehydrogenase [Polyangiales bacterium]|nr:homoserine dehydrogenase [Polyangiales bacterium]
MRNIRIGMIGCGVVGQGILRLLKENAASLEGRLGGAIEVRRIAVRDPSKERGPYTPMALLTSDPLAVVADPDVDIVVEVMGGVEPADGYLTRALEAGKSVVTANKALLAARGHQLIELAEARGADLYFEAAVAGGVPVIRVLREAFASDRIIAVRGIINGTSNYILSRMQEAGIDFAPALGEAQQKGYAEADPTLDVGGGDAAHKLTILATLAYGVRLDLEQVATSGIDQVSAIDIAFANRFGYVIKPLAIAKALTDGALDLRVHPALVSKKSVLASVNGALNAVYIEGAALGPCLLSGLGAGALPTAVSVVSDIVDVGRNLRSASGGRVPQRAFRGDRMTVARVQPPADHRCRFYLRFSVQDKSGVLGKLATSLGKHSVSIEQMVQEGHQSETPVSVVVLTHPAREGDVREALREIDGLDVVAAPTRLLRIEES